MSDDACKGENIHKMIRWLLFIYNLGFIDHLLPFSVPELTQDGDRVR